MGKPKQLLTLKENYMLEQVITNCLEHPFEDILTVIGCEAPLIRERISVSDQRFKWVNNSEYQKRQSTSFRQAINHVNPDHSFLMIFLGDQPFIKKESISSIFKQGLEFLNQCSNPFVMRPVYQDSIGHPVFLGNLQSLNTSNLVGDSGGSQLLRSISHNFNVQVEDPMIAFDIDTPEDYLKAQKLLLNV